jgi:hypothetical protein
MKLHLKYVCSVACHYIVVLLLCVPFCWGISKLANTHTHMKKCNNNNINIVGIMNKNRTKWNLLIYLARRRKGIRSTRQMLVTMCETLLLRKDDFIWPVRNIFIIFLSSRWTISICFIFNFVSIVFFYFSLQWFLSKIKCTTLFTPHISEMAVYHADDDCLRHVQREKKHFVILKCMTLHIIMHERSFYLHMHLKFLTNWDFSHFIN